MRELCHGTTPDDWDEFDEAEFMRSVALGKRVILAIDEAEARLEHQNRESVKSN